MTGFVVAFVMFLGMVGALGAAIVGIFKPTKVLPASMGDRRTRKAAFNLWMLAASSLFVASIITLVSSGPPEVPVEGTLEARLHGTYGGGFVRAKGNDPHTKINNSAWTIRVYGPPERPTHINGEFAVPGPKDPERNQMVGGALWMIIKELSPQIASEDVLVITAAMGRAYERDGEETGKAGTIRFRTFKSLFGLVHLAIDR